jgi:hypothetical protein
MNKPIHVFLETTGEIPAPVIHTTAISSIYFRKKSLPLGTPLARHWMPVYGLNLGAYHYPYSGWEALGL